MLLSIRDLESTCYTFAVSPTQHTNVLKLGHVVLMHAFESISLILCFSQQCNSTGFKVELPERFTDIH